MAKVLASLENVSVAYGRRLVLDGATLAVQTGDFWTLIGPNGAGKSTLLGLFNGLTAPLTGRATFKGLAVSGRTAARLRPEIAHVFQAVDLDPKMPLNVFEAVLAGTYSRLGLFRRPGAREKAIAERALEAVGLTDLRGRPIGQLSGGQRQRAALARALAQEPEFLLLDEPTAALDWRAQREIINIIAELRRNYNLTVFMATHDLNAVFSIAEKVAMLKDGRLIWEGPVERAMEPGLLSTLYSAPIRIASCEGRRIAIF